MQLFGACAPWLGHEQKSFPVEAPEGGLAARGSSWRFGAVELCGLVSFQTLGTWETEMPFSVLSKQL